MNDARSQFILFPLAGLWSGLLSGLCGFPLVLFAPGAIFGAVIGQAIHRSVSPLSLGARLRLIAASTGGYFSAIVLVCLCVRISSGDSPPGTAVVIGAFSGGFGSLMLAAGLVAATRQLSPPRSLGIITSTGVVLGAAFTHSIDFLDLPQPLGVILIFQAWQTGVAAVIPLCLRPQHFSHEQHPESEQQGSA